MDARLRNFALASSAGLLALAAFAWIAHGEAVFMSIVDAALALCM